MRKALDCADGCTPLWRDQKPWRCTFYLGEPYGIWIRAHNLFIKTRKKSWHSREFGTKQSWEDSKKGLDWRLLWEPSLNPVHSTFLLAHLISNSESSLRKKCGTFHKDPPGGPGWSYNGQSPQDICSLTMPENLGWKENTIRKWSRLPPTRPAWRMLPPPLRKTGSQQVRSWIPLFISTVEESILISL